MTGRKGLKDHDTGYAEALEEVAAHLRGEMPLETLRATERRVVDIPALRKRYGMTQQQFADTIGIAVGTLRNWEQGRRVPEGPAQRLLEIIEDQPDMALKTLKPAETDQVPRARSGQATKRPHQAPPDLVAGAYSLATGDFSEDDIDRMIDALPVLRGASKRSGPATPPAVAPETPGVRRGGRPARS